MTEIPSIIVPSNRTARTLFGQHGLFLPSLASALIGLGSSTPVPLLAVVPELQDKEAAYLAGGLWLVACIVYRLTRYPDINGGDSVRALTPL